MLSSAVAHFNRSGQEFVSRFIDGTDIEVDGKCFEDDIRLYQIHSLFCGDSCGEFMYLDESE